MLKPYYFQVNFAFFSNKDLVDNWFDKVVWAESLSEAKKRAENVADNSESRPADELSKVQEVLPNIIVTLRNEDGTTIRQEQGYETWYGHEISCPSLIEGCWTIVSSSDPTRY